MYRLLLHPSIEKQLARIPRDYSKRLAEAMRALREEPRPNGCRHLADELYRIREGDYRVVYAVFDSEQIVFVGKVARRSEKIYRDLAVIVAAARAAAGRE